MVFQSHSHLLFLLGREDLGMIKLVLTGPEFHIAQGQKQQVGHKQQVAKPFSPLQALPSVRSKSHQNWVDYPSLSLRKAWKLRTLTQYVLFCGRGRSLKCGIWDQQAP